MTFIKLENEIIEKISDESFTISNPLINTKLVYLEDVKIIISEQFEKLKLRKEKIL